MKQLLVQVRGDHCTKCKSPRSIECYTKFDKPINYTYFLDQLEKGKTNVLENLDKIEITTMRCKKCNEQYFIDWRKSYPLPVRDFYLIEGVFLNHIYN